MSDQNNSNNGLNHASNDGLNDADIKHLFDQQHDEPPQALDELILAAAKTSNKKLPDSDTPPRFSQKYTAVFGLAAVVLLSVVVVPLMIKQPESQLDAMITGNDQAVASLLEQEKKQVTTSTEQATFSADINTEITAIVEEFDASGGGDAGNTMADTHALTSASSSGQAVSAKGAQRTAKARAENTTTQLASEAVALNSSPAALQTQEARAELARFRQQHPDSEYEAQLPAALREQDRTD